MTDTAGLAAGSAGAPTCPTTWTLPRMPDEDVDAVRALAAAYQQLASELRGAGQAAQVALSQLPGAWTGDAAFNFIWTSLHVPCVTVPAGTGPHGMPLGVQIVAPRGRDREALA